MMNRVITEIEADAFFRLMDLAMAERRTPREQAGWLLERAIAECVARAQQSGVELESRAQEQIGAAS